MLFNNTPPTSITHNGIEYSLSQFSKEIQEKTEIYHKWQQELTQIQLDAFKTKSAMELLAQDVYNHIEAELQAKSGKSADTPKDAPQST